jgi:hypothetical protein
VCLLHNDSASTGAQHRPCRQVNMSSIFKVQTDAETEMHDGSAFSRLIGYSNMAIKRMAGKCGKGDRSTSSIIHQKGADLC